MDRSALLFLLLVAAAGVQQANPAAKKVTRAQLWALDGSYHDARHGVSFRYPKLWQATDQFAYHPPALTDLETTRPTAAFGYDAKNTVGSPYDNTNLEGFGVVYAALAAQSGASCERMAAGLAMPQKPATSTFAGQVFSVRHTGEAGMNQGISGTLYTTYLRETCYLFETDVADMMADPDDGYAQLPPKARRRIDLGLLEIMRSVRIVVGR